MILKPVKIKKFKNIKQFALSRAGSNMQHDLCCYLEIWKFGQFDEKGLKWDVVRKDLH